MFLLPQGLNEILGTKGGGAFAGCSRRGSQSDDTEDEDYGSSLSRLTNEDWLLSSLPNTPHFAVILPRVYPLLLRASIMETNLACLQSFFQFLTQHPPEDKIYESAISLSSVVVDRFDIVKKLFTSRGARPSTTIRMQQTASGDVPIHVRSCSDPGGVVILGSLLSMLRRAMELAIHSQTMPQLSSSEEFLLVSFPRIGKKTILHTSLIQAVMLLLTFDLPSTADPSDYKYFLEQWFPVQEENCPEAHAVESKEKATFPHPSILPYMLLSNSPRILSASIASSSPSQLCSFVKQFGCPLQAVEKILEALDGLCDEHDPSTELRRCVHDPVEMCKFVEVHILRGVTSGRTFLSFLQGLASVATSEQPETSISAIFEKEASSLTSSSSSTPSAFGFSSQTSLTSSTIALPSRTSSQSYAKFSNSSQEELEKMLQQSFSPGHGKRGSSSSGKAQQMASELVSALRHCASAGLTVSAGTAKSDGGTGTSESFVSRLIAGLNRLLSTSKAKKQFFEGMVQSRHAISLLRMITKIAAQSSTTLKSNGSGGGRPSSLAGQFCSTLQVILQALESHSHSSSSNKYAVFSAAVKSCAKQLGMEHQASITTSSIAYKLETAVGKACKEIGESKDPFRNKSALVRLCHNVTQAGLPAPFEQLVSSVVKRAIFLGREQQCVQFLYAIKASTSDSTLPVVLKFFPSYFMIRSGDDEGGGGTLLSRSQSPEDELMETNSAINEKSPTSYWQSGNVHVDICGLLVDWLELLDPEVLALSPEHSMKMVFGGSNTEQLSAILASCRKAQEKGGGSSEPAASQLSFLSSSSSQLRLCSSLLLCGQGYLQDRLTNCSSWPTLTGTIKTLLSSEHANEW